jgi:hypothetical protein
VLTAGLRLQAEQAKPAGPVLAGTWIGKTDVPDQGPDAVTLVLNSAGKGYAGRLSDSLGQVASAVDLKDVQFDGSALTFKFFLSDGTEMVMTLKVTGEKMAGQWLHPEGSAGAITFEKQK